MNVTWPNDTKCIVVLTFDIDGVSGAINEAKKISKKAIDSLSIFGEKANTLRHLSKKIVKAPENKLNLSNNKNPQRINTPYVSTKI